MIPLGTGKDSPVSWLNGGLSRIGRITFQGGGLQTELPSRKAASVIPFTLIAILPTNERLLSPALDRRSVEAERLLGRGTRCTL